MCRYSVAVFPGNKKVRLVRPIIHSGSAKLTGSLRVATLNDLLLLSRSVSFLADQIVIRLEFVSRLNRNEHIVFCSDRCPKTTRGAVIRQLPFNTKDLLLISVNAPWGA